MSEIDIPSLSWSVGLRARHDRDIERDIAAVVEAMGQALAEHFPEGGGYETTWSRLSGPIEGTVARVTRRRFRAVVSVQRFARAHAALGPGGRSVEVRLVATAEVAPPAGSVRAEPSISAGTWSAAFCALGTAVFGATALVLGGVLTASAQALLLVPTILVWRATLALSRPEGRSPPSLSGTVQSRPRPRDPAAADAVARWRRALVHLQAQRQLLDDRSSLPPFRVPPAALSETG